MRSIPLCFFIFLASVTTWAQAITCSPENKEAVIQKILEVKGIDNELFGEELVAIGKTFIGVPYVAKTLEVGEEESLVITLEGLDCTTYVENVLAFGLVNEKTEPNFDSFVKTLEKIRYRDGQLNGYGSRLHYFTEWISDNEKKGLVQNITASLGGAEIDKKLNFMSVHRDLYPHLKDDKSFQHIQETEKKLQQQSLCILSQEMLAMNEDQIHSGDIIALATSIEGLDVTHTGFAIRADDGRIHLLHASSSGAVEISALPLVDYLKKIKKNTGVIVARPL
ncbi:N-acetylmuramoyl-L-alanine amidase-like domain-containing protein [uncultured Muriicola sp.]|uniref:N-acetylmuramoyl-L-alanine amidase-like domain-containing protein n=1 Tax=uncultured Muriicola sp. TaxID=1583102 RepID=UPI002622B24F|nr:N-acetylmuramoyl-L-alanine amidase-like domain-containing protein [uncultured Muriicola sp.]